MTSRERLIKAIETLNATKRAGLIPGYIQEWASGNGIDINIQFNNPTEEALKLNYDVPPVQSFSFNRNWLSPKVFDLPFVKEHVNVNTLGVYPGDENYDDVVVIAKFMCYFYFWGKEKGFIK